MEQKAAKVFTDLDSDYRPRKSDKGRLITINYSSLDALRESLEKETLMKIHSIFSYGRGRKRSEVTTSADCMKLGLSKSISLGVLGSNDAAVDEADSSQAASADDRTLEGPPTDHLDDNREGNLSSTSSMPCNERPTQTRNSKRASDTCNDGQPLKKKSNSVKSNNNNYNSNMVALIEYLRKRGMNGRYSSKHLDLWVSEILEGKLSGPTEEPKWEQFLDIVEYPPRTGPLRRQSGNMDLMQHMMLINEESRREQRELMRIREEERRADERRREEARQEEREERRNDDRRRDEMFQRSLVMLACGKPVTSVMSGHGTDIMDWNVQQVQEFLVVNGFREYVGSFVDNGIDGSTLTKLTDAALEALGVQCPIVRAKLLGKIEKMK